MFHKLFIQSELIQFLNIASCRSIIASILLSGDNRHLKDVGNFIKINNDEIDVISYLPKFKYEKVDDVWDNNSRVNIKVGRFIKKFISPFSIENYGVNDSEIEKFVNLYKSYFSNSNLNFKIVSGTDIMKYYLSSNYHTIDGLRHGSIWNSCMRQSDRNKFLELYSKNDSIKMLLLLTDSGKVRARALLWDNIIDHNSDNVYKVMDRIYTIFDHDVNLFKKWANDNDYISKWQQNSKSEILFDIDTKLVKLSLYAILNIDIEYFPYLDTFKYFKFSEKRFSNSIDFNYDYKLVQSNGMVENNRINDNQIQDITDDEIYFGDTTFNDDL